MHPELPGVASLRQTQTKDVANETSGRFFFKNVEEFGLYSGLKLNRSKTVAAWLGINRDNTSSPLVIIKWQRQPLKMVGVYFSYD
jgi:hypothetical protein